MADTPKKPAAASGAERRSLRVDPIVAVNKRNRDLERRTQRMTGALVMLTGALAVSVTGNVMQGLHRPEPRYFAQNEATGSLTPIVPLNKPIGSTNTILQHGSDVIMDLYALDFQNYRSQLQRASDYFTQNGWQKYVSEFESTGNLAAIKERRMVLSGVVTKPPVVVQSGEVFGTLYWDIEVPYQVRYIAAGFDQTQDLVARIKIVRVPTTQNPRGIAIAQFVSRQLASGANGG